MNHEIEDLFMTNMFKEDLGTIRIARWPEGIVIWVGGQIRWKSWAQKVAPDGETIARIIEPEAWAWLDHLVSTGSRRDDCVGGMSRRSEQIRGSLDKAQQLMALQPAVVRETCPDCYGDGSLDANDTESGLIEPCQSCRASGWVDSKSEAIATMNHPATPQGAEEVREQARDMLKRLWPEHRLVMAAVVDELNSANLLAGPVAVTMEECEQLFHVAGETWNAMTDDNGAEAMKVALIRVFGPRVQIEGDE